MNDKFGTTTQPAIKNVTKNNNTCVLELVMFYETRHKNTTGDFIVLSCVIYDIIKNYVCIDYIACQSRKLSVLCKNINYTVILLCCSRLLAYYFSKGFVMLERNSKAQ